MSVQFFEGVEKLLEIWFSTNVNNNHNKKETSQQQQQQQQQQKLEIESKHDLRIIPRQKWESLLKIVRCEIISFCRNDSVDAYVLSESSMFVSKRRLILKTCGTTTPLQCLEPLLDLVESYTGFDKVENLFYSRKNYKRPELQIAPHRAFEEEVTLLDTFFPGKYLNQTTMQAGRIRNAKIVTTSLISSDGEAYCLGSEESECWYLYTLNREAAPSSAPQPTGQQESTDDAPPTTTTTTTMNEREPDQTLEIMMTQLDPEVMSIFTRHVCSSAEEATRKSGIDQLLPNMLIDDFLFEPCGYSMNGVSKNGSYMTIHITPEPDFSYVSFESNVAAASYGDVIERVLRCFKPGKFVVSIFANKQSVAAEGPRELEQSDDCLGGLRRDYVRDDAQYCRFKNYDLSCAFYSKFPS
ncbi:unnamed protein product [Trichogramma brassicae]|uniref:adenosylmethionine decarboxylase n=1 Tax=Trichogramma brassicae TaxID=86971 RepID=A0A6H5IKH4_9HYME|nr:unnamed protein product [Trichogramma brassicae]